MQSSSTSSSDPIGYLFDLGAAGLLGGFTLFLLLGMLWSSGAFNDVAAPFLLGAFGVLFIGNRRQDGGIRGPSTPPVRASGPPTP
jgi:hypothetical protein